jgi:hypothetical protein
VFGDSGTRAAGAGRGGRAGAPGATKRRGSRGGVVGGWLPLGGDDALRVPDPAPCCMWMMRTGRAPASLLALLLRNRARYVRHRIPANARAFLAALPRVLIQSVLVLPPSPSVVMQCSARMITQLLSNYNALARPPQADGDNTSAHSAVFPPRAAHALSWQPPMPTTPQ